MDDGRRLYSNLFDDRLERGYEEWLAATSHFTGVECMASL